MTSRMRYLTTFVASPTVVAVALFVLPAPLGVGQDAAPQARCDLVAAYDAVLVVPGGRELDVTDDNRAELLEGVRLCVESLLAPETLVAYREAEALLGGPTDTNQDRADRDLIRIEIAALLSADASMQQQRAVARRIAGGADALALAVKRQAAEISLQSSGWSPVDAKGGPRHDAVKYVKACAMAHVPVPKSLTTGAGWSGPVVLDSETGHYLILTEKRSASVWTYRNPSGGYCVTLKRQNPKKIDELPLVGTICTNAAETHACFFDNVVAAADGKRRRLSLEELSSTDLSSLLHPMDVVDNCSTCHIGANPFLVDPKTVLGKTIIAQYGGEEKSKRFEFAGFDSIKGGWFNFTLIDNKTSETGCMKCHDLPEVTKDHRFCTAIIQKAANTTMPPGYWDKKPTHGRKEFWPGSDGCFDRSLVDLAEYFDSLRQIKAICNGVKVPMCPNPDGLASPKGP